MATRRVLAGPLLAALSSLGCLPIPHRVATLHEIVLTFRSPSPTKAGVAVTQVHGDARCAQAIRKVEVRNGETKVIAGQSEERLWLLLVPHDPVSGFRVCIEQDQRRFLGVEYFHLGYSDARVKVACDVSGETAPPVEGNATGLPRAPEVCAVSGVR
jgi:hypothetical protein